MPYYDVSNCVTVSIINMTDKMSCCCGTLRTTGGRICHQDTRRACPEVSARNIVGSRRVVLSTDPGNPPLRRVWTAKTDLFSARHVQKPDPVTQGRLTTDRYPSSRRFRLVWLDPSVPIFISAFQVSHLLSHSDMLQLMVQYCHWYVTVYFLRFSSLHVLINHTHGPNHILNRSINRGSTQCQRYTVLQSLLPIKVANNSSMTDYNLLET
jgi:hypothetical protein